MIKKVFKVDSKIGLHARPIGLLVNTVSKFQSNIWIAKDGEVVNGKSIMGVLTLALEPGSEMEITIEGPDEQEMLQAIEELFAKNFYEDDFMLKKSKKEWDNQSDENKSY